MKKYYRIKRKLSSVFWNVKHTEYISNFEYKVEKRFLYFFWIYEWLYQPTFQDHSSAVEYIKRRQGILLTDH